MSDISVIGWRERTGRSTHRDPARTALARALADGDQVAELEQLARVATFTATIGATTRLDDVDPTATACV